MAFPASFQDITQAVIDLIRLTVADDTTRVQDAINTAYYETMVENEVLVSSGSAALTTGISTYDLDTVTQIARIKDIWADQNGAWTPPLRQVSIDRILYARQTNAGVSVTSPGTMMWYSLSGQNQLDIYPEPSSSFDLHFVYVGFPTALSGTDVPQLPEPYSSNCLTYGAAVPMAEFKSDPQLPYFQQQSDVWQSKLRRHLNLRRGMPGAFEHISDHPWPPHDRATILPWRGF